jgi:hypothetical protein
MNRDQFENTLRQFVRREPFQPFVVELLDGRIIQIASPRVVMGGGGASFFTPDYDLIEFTCEEVRAIRHTVSGAAS